jgi:MtN3 and saliva related transmembrane protein
VIQALGIMAAALTSLSYIPQVRKAWPRGSTDDLSLRTLGILAAGLALWIVYGLARADTVIVVANAVGLFLILFLMALKWRDA